MTTMKESILEALKAAEELEKQLLKKRAKRASKNLQREPEPAKTKK
jgi:hypothetical protein